jgi:NAD(P)-dependent dehydrogenase (short-subunit alcohol dehydrogenase family)
MYRDLKDKTAVVTGSGKRTGIGYAIAEKLAASGCNIVISDLGEKSDPDNAVSTGSSDEMKEIADSLNREYGIRAIYAELDVTSRESVEELSRRVKDEFMGIDIICNNAGASFGVPCGLATYNEEAWIKTIDVNLFGVFRITQGLIPLMPEENGSIVNIASRAGKVPPLFNSAYAVAKAGLIMLTKVMAKEFAGRGIRANAICPGQIKTDLEKWRFGLEAKFMNTSIEERESEMCKTIPLGRIGDTMEVASLAAFLASEESSYITGQAINITGGQLMEV